MTSLFHKHDVNPIGPDMPMDAKILVRYPMAIVRRILPDSQNFWNLKKLNDFHPSPSTGLNWQFIHVKNWVWHYSLCRSAKCPSCDGNGYFDHYDQDYDCQMCDGAGDFVDGETFTARVNFEGQLLDVTETGMS